MGVLFFVLAVYGYVIGNISTLLANHDIAKANYVNKIEELNVFFNDKHIPPALQAKVKEYYNHLWQSRLGKDESTILADLPDTLRTEVTLCLNREIIHKVPIFKNVKDEFIRQIANCLKPAVIVPDDYIIRKGELGEEMFFLSRGKAELLDEQGNVLGVFSDGSYFGEMSLLLRQPRMADIRAVEYCDVYILGKEIFDSMLEKYPEFRARIQATLRARQESNEGRDKRRTPSSNGKVLTPAGRGSEVF